jgi:hypothetical protein
MSGNCSELNYESSFAAYVALMRNVTSQNLSLDSMVRCRPQICSVLYGVGNPDISGVGVIAIFLSFSNLDERLISSRYLLATH